MDTVRRHSVAEVPVGKNRNTPVLVHCGAGVGRTGVTIACDVLLNMLNHNIVSWNKEKRISICAVAIDISSYIEWMDMLTVSFVYH